MVLTAERQRMRPADVVLGMTATEQQMSTGCWPGYKAEGMMGGGRDEDGVDRVKEPPDALKGILKEGLKLQKQSSTRNFVYATTFHPVGGCMLPMR